jgi:hypothetical protein
VCRSPIISLFRLCFGLSIFLHLGIEVFNLLLHGSKNVVELNPNSYITSSPFFMFQFIVTIMKNKILSGVPVVSMNPTSENINTVVC